MYAIFIWNNESTNIYIINNQKRIISFINYIFYKIKYKSSCIYSYQYCNIITFLCYLLQIIVALLKTKKQPIIQQIQQIIWFKIRNSLQILLIHKPNLEVELYFKIFLFLDSLQILPSFQIIKLVQLLVSLEWEVLSLLQSNSLKTQNYLV